MFIVNDNLKVNVLSLPGYAVSTAEPCRAHQEAA